MGTAAGFFGITYQGAVNGLASVTLSIFNMVRARPALAASWREEAAAATPPVAGRHAPSPSPLGGPRPLVAVARGRVACHA